MPFSKCLRAKIYSNMIVYFDPQGCQTLLLKESDPLLFSLGSWTIIPLISIAFSIHGLWTVPVCKLSCVYLIIKT